MRTSASRTLSCAGKATALAVALEMLLWPGIPALALPQGEKVTSGSVEFDRAPGSLTVIQNTGRAIVNFESFDIAAPETVRFVQPDSSSAILNRVTGDEQSVIAGILLGNGNVFLINTHGILFSSTAKINVSALFASALDMSDSDFLAGVMRFHDGNGPVVNRGSIVADKVVLFGNSVENAGRIQAAAVTMASARNSILIDEAAGGEIRLILDGVPAVAPAPANPEPPAPPPTPPAAPPDAAPAGEPDAGQTEPDAGPTEPDAAQDPVTGDTAPGDDATARAGTVINEGLILAVGETGGSVLMQGTRVGQFGTVSADGIGAGGGAVTLYANEAVALGEGSLTTANAGENGNGGDILVLSPDTAIVRRNARLEARGGSESGDGGSIEVSGWEHVEIMGVADASAANGRAGSFTIDPDSNIEIKNPVLPETDTGTWTPVGPPPYSNFAPSQDDAIIDIANLLASLRNNDVFITTVNNLTGSQAGNITVTDPIDLDGTGGNTLRLQAQGGIVVNAAMADLTTGAGTDDETFFELSALTGGVTINNAISTGGGNLTISAAGDVAVNAPISTDGVGVNGMLTSSGAGFTTAAGATIVTGGGDVNLSGHSGNVTIGDLIDASGAGAGYIGIGGDSISLNAGGPVTLDAAVVSIRANDLDIPCGINATSVTITEGSGDGIGLGAAVVPGGLNVAGAELQRITASSIEFDTAGPITVNGVSAADSDNAGAVTLDSGSGIQFAGGDSTFDALIAEADDGISFTANARTDEGDMSLDGDADNAADGNDGIAFMGLRTLASAGNMVLDATGGGISASGITLLTANGNLTVNDDATFSWSATLRADNDQDGSGAFMLPAGAALNSVPGQTLRIAGNDADIQGTISAQSVLLQDYDGNGIGLGAAVVAGGFNIAGAELQRITASSLELETAGPITVNGVSAADSDNAGTVTLDSGSGIQFAGGASTFDALVAQADNGMLVDVGITADSGNLSLDADANGVADGGDTLEFAAGVQVTSAGAIALDAQNGGIVAHGALSLLADNGVAINDDLGPPPAPAIPGGPLLISADADGIGGGTFSLASAAILVGIPGSCEIAADDVSILGNIDLDMLTIRDSDGSGIGLGSASVIGGLNIDGNELRRISSPVLQLSTPGSIQVDNVLAADSQNVDDLLLQAVQRVDFVNRDSTFNRIAVSAEDGISVGADVIADTGDVSFDGDADDGADLNDDIFFANAVRIQAAGAILLEADNGGIATAGSLLLEADAGISIFSDFAGGGTLLMIADADRAGGGALTVPAGVALDVGANILQITADDVALGGSMVAGNATIFDSDGDGIGLGISAVAGGLNLSGAEISGIAANSLSLSTAGSASVDGVSAAESEAANAVFLDATGSISFQNTASTFDSLTATADNGIIVNADLTTDTDDLSLDGDADNAADGDDRIRFGDGVRLEAAGTMTLEATSGGMTGDGVLTLVANDGISVNSALSTAGALTFDGDVAAASGVSLRSGADLVVTDGKKIRGLGSLSVRAGGDLTVGGDASSFGTMVLAADSDGSNAGRLWIKGDVFTDGVVPAGTVTLVGDIAVDGSMTIGAASMTLSGADRDDVDYVVEAPIRAGGIVIRMGRNITDGTAGENGALTANSVSLSARTGSIGGPGNADLDTDAGGLSARAGGNIYIEERSDLGVAGGVAAGGSVSLSVHGNLSADLLQAGGAMNVAADGAMVCNELRAGGNMDLDGRSLEFTTLNAADLDADASDFIRVGAASLSGDADLSAGGEILDNNSMITARNLVMSAGGNVGGSAININVESISSVTAGGLVHLVQHRQGDTPIGLVSAGDYFDISVPNGGLTDNNGDAVNLRANNVSYLSLHGACGWKCDPLEIEILDGNLLADAINLSRADTEDNWIWISLAGVITPANNADSPIDYIGEAEVPGLILFNMGIAGGEEAAATAIYRTEAFTLETPELKSRQGVFGSPYFLHGFLNLNEPLALGLVDYILYGQALVNADPEFTEAAKRTIRMWPEGFVW